MNDLTAHPDWFGPFFLIGLLAFVIAQRLTRLPLYKFVYPLLAGPGEDNYGWLDEYWSPPKEPRGVNSRDQICRWEDDGGQVVRLWDAETYWKQDGFGKNVL